MSTEQYSYSSYWYILTYTGLESVPPDCTVNVTYHNYSACVVIKMNHEENTSQSALGQSLNV
jgi:hypothetical protein